MDHVIVIAIAFAALFVLGGIFYFVSGRAIGIKELQMFIRLCVLAADQAIPGATKSNKRHWVAVQVQEFGPFSHLDIEIIEDAISSIMEFVEGEDLADGTDR